MPTPFCADLTEFDMSNESEETFTEDEQLEQLLNGDIWFKFYRFGSNTFLVGLNNVHEATREKSSLHGASPADSHTSDAGRKIIYTLWFF